MKKPETNIFLYLFFFTLVTFSEHIVLAQGVKFTEIKSPVDWENSLERARKENKMLFLDIYATWCGPCKMMDSQVYTDSAVAKLFNDHYINARIDGESQYGKNLVKRFKLTAYPSMYFLNYDDKLILTVIGYKDPGALNSLGTQILEKGSSFIMLSDRYESGQMSPAESKEYLRLLLDFGQKDRYQQAVSYTINTMSEEEILDPVNREIILNGGGNIESKAVNTVLMNPERFKNLWGAEDFSKYLSGVFNSSMETAVRENDENKMEKIAEVLIPVYMAENPAQVNPAKLTTRKIFFAETGKWDKYINAVENYRTNFAADDKQFFYNEAYYIVSNQIMNPGMLDKALEWVNRSISSLPGFEPHFLGAIIHTYRKDYLQAETWYARAKTLAVSEEDKKALDDLRGFIDNLKSGKNTNP